MWHDTPKLLRRAGLVLLLGGCSAAYQPPPLPIDHPARPDAAEAPRPEPSRALTGAVLPEPPESADPHAHHGHGMPTHHHGEER